MRSIFTGIVAAVAIAVASFFLLDGGLQRDVGEAYHTSGVRL
jgi:hypothetical protein